MHSNRRTMRLSLLMLGVWIGIGLITAGAARAADPAFVGILSLAVEEQGARHLGLSDEVRETLRRLVDQRVTEATTLALSVKDLPPELRAERLAPFVAESERLGFELLTQEQRSKLNQLRLQRTGMASLADDEMARLLGLSDDQRDAVARLMAERAKAMTRGGAAEQRLARDTHERQLRSVLTREQKSMWDQLAGLGPGPTSAASPAAAAAQPEPNAAEEAAAAAPADSAPEAPLAEQAPAPAAPAEDAQPAVAAPDEPQPEAGPADAAGEDASSPPADAASPPAMAAQPADGEVAQQPAVTPAAPDAQPDAAPAAPTELPDTPEDDDSAQGLAQPDPEAVKLRFNFRYQPWQDVLDWLAEQADLSLQSTLVPEGTFNYSDSQAYTPSEAIDLINGVLLPQGYTLVRRGRLLSVMSLEDEVPDVLVEFAPIEKLEGRGEFELVKTVFHLAKLEPTEVEQEIQQLLGPGRKMVVMPRARQILVTETVGKLRMIRDVIESAENPTGIKEKGIVEIKLQFVAPEEVLTIARPLLGLEDGKDVGPEVSIAVDPLGTRIFATGSRDKIQILQELVETVDVKREAATAAVALEQPQLLTHQLGELDPQEALAVLQTLLAGLPDVRMSLDAKTKKVIALARPSEHRTIQETIRQLEGEAPQLKVFQVRTMDVKTMAAALTKFFPPAKEGDTSGITVDADPLSAKLLVHATPKQLEQVAAFIEQLEGSAAGGSTSTLRFIPLTGSEAVSAVEMAERLWRGPNQIRMTTPSETGPGVIDLREVPLDPQAVPEYDPTRPTPGPQRKTTGENIQPSAAAPAAPERPRDKVTWQEDEETEPLGTVSHGPFRLTSYRPDGTAQDDAGELPASAAGMEAADAPRDDAPPVPPASATEPAADAAGPPSDIRIEFTPNGILISSEDTVALDEFEEILRTVMPPSAPGTGKNFTVYFLKHCKAEVARQLISDILGGTSEGGSGGGSLVGDVAANLMGGGGGILGALLGSAGGGDGGVVTTVQVTGPVSIVADTRLNCLIVQALPVDVKLIEQLLKVIDREGSITDVQTAGKPHVLPIRYLEAELVAGLVREAFANRMVTAGGGQAGGQPNPVELIRALRGGRGGRAEADVKSEEAKMTITVDNRSNSLIVTAPEPLFEQVRELVELIDIGSPELDETIEIVEFKSNPDTVQRALSAITGATTTSPSGSSRSQSGQRPGGAFGMPFGTPASGGAVPFMQRPQGMGGMPGGFGGFGGMPGLGGQRGGMPGASGGQRSGMGGMRGGMPGGTRGGTQRGGTRSGAGGRR